LLLDIASRFEKGTVDSLPIVLSIFPRTHRRDLPSICSSYTSVGSPGYPWSFFLGDDLQ